MKKEIENFINQIITEEHVEDAHFESEIREKLIEKYDQLILNLNTCQRIREDFYKFLED